MPYQFSDPFHQFEPLTLDEMEDAWRKADARVKTEGLEPWTDDYLETRDRYYEELTE